MKKLLVVLTSLLVCGVQGSVKPQTQAKSTRWQKVKNAGSSLKTRFSIDTIRKNLETSDDRANREDTNRMLMENYSDDYDRPLLLKPGESAKVISSSGIEGRTKDSTVKMAVKSFKENLYSRPKNWIKGRIKAKADSKNLINQTSSDSVTYSETGQPVTAYSESDRQVDSQKAKEVPIEFSYEWHKQNIADDIENYLRNCTDDEIRALGIYKS